MVRLKRTPAPASFWDGRPAVFGSVAHGGCPSDACVLRAYRTLTVGTDYCRARSTLQYLCGCRQGLPPSPLGELTVWRPPLEHPFVPVHSLNSNPSKKPER